MTERPDIALSVSGETLTQFATTITEAILDQLREALEPEPWLDVAAAANHLSCNSKRIYDLVAQKRLRSARDGRRLLFRREWLDAAVETDHTQ